MNSLSKWFAAALLSTSLIFTGNVAEAAKKKTKTKSHATHVHKKTDKKKKKKTAKRAVKPSEGYVKASSYMKRDVASTPSKKAKKSKHKSAKKKKAHRHSSASFSQLQYQA